jgi:hypothetical protein
MKPNAMRPLTWLAVLVGGSVLVPITGAGEPTTAKVKPHDSTLGAKLPEGAVTLFDGKDLSGWVDRDGKAASWPVSDGIVTVGNSDIMTKEKFGNYRLHIEFNVPYMPKAHGQARGNSGVYQVGSYEVQVLDSYGLKPQDNDCGAIYKQVIPKVNACKPPLQWQSYDITFHKAKLEDGKVNAKARITIVQNGITIAENAEVSPTPGGIDVPEGNDGPILLQNHGNPVQYRNIWLLPIE